MSEPTLVEACEALIADHERTGMWRLPDRFRDIKAALVRETSRRATYCACGAFVSDPSGDAGCGNCGADEPPVGWEP